MPEIQGVRVFECPTDGAWNVGADIVIMLVARLGDEFFRLRTGVAGEMVSKFARYGVRVAVAGDISGWVAESTALRDFVYESNRGDQLR